MDSVKPFLAALLGWLILGESLQWPAFVGMALTLGGVVWVSLERESPAKGDDGGANNECEDSDRFDDDDDEEDQEDDESKEGKATANRKRVMTPKERRKGYALSVANVILDTYGSLLTKQYGVGMSTWNISLIRFGFASAFCVVLSSILNLRDVLRRTTSSINKEENKSDIESNKQSLRGSVLELFNYRLGKDTCMAQKQNNEEYENNSIDKAGDDEEKIRSTDRERPWYSLPKMPRKSYAIISLGVAFTTFATPALSNYALFQIALALALTLGSMGPIYMLPLGWLIQGDRPTLRACLGAALAVGGVAILSFFG
jgi:uncharacterized membrane protein